MSKYLGATEPDECIMLFLRQVLQRAKEDGVSLGIYDDTDNHTSETNVCTINIDKNQELLIINFYRIST
jgi:hypothetical protein